MATELQKLSKENAIALAERMKKSAKRVRENAEKLTERLVNGAIATASGFGMGYWMGSAEAEYQKLLAKHKAEGLSQKDAETAIAKEGDPRKWAGIDKDLVVSVVIGGLAMTNLAGRRVSPMLESAAFGGLAGWAYSKGMESAIEADAEEEEEEDA